MGLRRTLGEFWREWASRRAGRRHVPNDIRLHARDIAGVTGWLYSRGWDQVAGTTATYRQSFEDPRVPPSLHVSERDRRRRGTVIPVVERCLADHALPGADRPGPWSTAELTPAPGDRRLRGPGRRHHLT